MKGKLIIIEGSDSSGKATQTKKLYERLIEGKVEVQKVEFPNYESASSALVKMYLDGSFGSNPNDVNPYVASTFYAVDRYASYKTEWQNFYSEGGIILSDRYTTSNMIHQAAKIDNIDEKNKYLDWLWDFEFNIFNLPVPDYVIFLDMPPAVSRKLMEDRRNKFTGEEQKDIHESNYNYLINSYNNASQIADKYGWSRISCVKDDILRSIDDIHQEVYERVYQVIKE